MLKITIQPFFAITFFCIFLFSGSVNAGGWAKGYGDTVEEATENATIKAKREIASRGAGCLSGQIRLTKEEYGRWAVEVHYYQHYGSCDRRGDYNWVNDPCKLNKELSVCEE